MRNTEGYDSDVGFCCNAYLGHHGNIDAVRRPTHPFIPLYTRTIQIKAVYNNSMTSNQDNGNSTTDNT